MSNMKPASSRITKAGKPRPTHNFSETTSLTAKQTSYHNDSGLVYHQQEIPGLQGSSSWVTEYKTPKIVRTKNYPHEMSGARLLSDMVLRRLGRESQNLTLEALRALPWAYGERIWQQICDNHAESFSIWRMFANAYHHDFASEQHRYMLQIKSPTLRTEEYFEGIDAKNLAWFSCLRTSPKQLSTSELVSISKVGNLGVLDLSDGQLYIENRHSNFDQRILRTWSELALYRRAFKHLRVLILGWQENVDTWMFDYLDAFPRLEIVVLSHCHSIHHKNHKEWEHLAWEHGWQFPTSKRGVKQLRPLLDDKTLGKGAVSSIYYTSLHDFEGHVSDKYRRKPLLECWLGTPKEWKHIIDDFPGTGTIFFTRTKSITRPAVQPKGYIEMEHELGRLPLDISQRSIGSTEPTKPPKRRKQQYTTARLLETMNTLAN